jgi:hypothetical protein
MQTTEAGRVRLFRVDEVTEPGMLPAGHYIITRGERVLVETEILQATRPRDLRDEIRAKMAPAAGDGEA